MSNSLQEQLLKSGLVTKQQAHKVKQHKTKKNKQRHANKENVVEDHSLKVQQVANEKAKRDRDLNKRKEEQARQKAVSAEINQLITENSLKRDESCDIVYNFEHNNKVKRIYVNEEMKKQVMCGKAGIARIEGRYELVPQGIAEKIQQRNAKRVVILSEDEQAVDEDDAYSNYQVPDDLIW